MNLHNRASGRRIRVGTTDMPSSHLSASQVFTRLASGFGSRETVRTSFTRSISQAYSTFPQVRRWAVLLQRGFVGWFLRRWYWRTYDGYAGVDTAFTVRYRKPLLACA